MKLENTVLWEEKDLFTECATPEQGFLGYVRGWFVKDSFLLDSILDGSYKHELESLLHFLKSPGADYLLRSALDMEIFCDKKMKAHISHSFNRECWGFRVLNDDIVWYISCTPWNERRHFELYAYDRKILMATLAQLRGLPETCYGVFPYTGERICIRFGADEFDRFPQYGGNFEENRKYADEMNAPSGITLKEVSAMVNGAIYGWDTPAANPLNYSNDGHYIPSLPEEITKGDKKR